jgi:hypothetical protein
MPCQRASVGSNPRAPALEIHVALVNAEGQGAHKNNRR